MKLHAFDVEVGDLRLRAMTRDRARRALKGPAVIESTGQVIKPLDWKYHGTLSTTGVSGEQIDAIHRSVKSQGYVIVRLPSLLKHFYVFDVPFDGADVRVYSADKDLKEFRAARHRLELSPKGDLFAGAQETLIGEVEIPSRIEAEKMGLDYDQLQRQSFSVHILRVSDRAEWLKRALNRELAAKVPDLEKQFGIRITRLGVDRVTFGEPDTPNTPVGGATDEPGPEKPAAMPEPLPVTAPPVIPNPPQLTVAPADEKPRTEADRLIEYWKNKKWVAVLIILAICVTALAEALKGSSDILNLVSEAWNWLRH